MYDFKRVYLYSYIFPRVYLQEYWNIKFLLLKKYICSNISFFKQVISEGEMEKLPSSNKYNIMHPTQVLKFRLNFKMDNNLIYISANMH